MGILQGDGLRRAGEHRADVDPAVGQQGRAKGHPVGGIVVAADGEHRQLPRRQLGQKPVQQPHRFGRGNGLVVKIPGQQYAVHRGLIQQS